MQAIFRVGGFAWILGALPGRLASCSYSLAHSLARSSSQCAGYLARCPNSSLRSSGWLLCPLEVTARLLPSSLSIITRHPGFRIHVLEQMPSLRSRVLAPLMATDTQTPRCGCWVCLCCWGLTTLALSVDRAGTQYQHVGARRASVAGGSTL